MLSQPSQAIFVSIAPYDNVENNSNNNHESDIEVLVEICFHSDQNLNESHETVEYLNNLNEYLNKKTT